jgi:hypothetical protein
VTFLCIPMKIGVKLNSNTSVAGQSPHPPPPSARGRTEVDGRGLAPAVAEVRDRAALERPPDLGVDIRSSRLGKQRLIMIMIVNPV